VRIVHFDPFSGASGDMILGALIDAGASLDSVKSELAKLDLSGYEVTATPHSQHGISGTKFDVVVQDDVESRDWKAIRALIAESGLRPQVRNKALGVFGRLARAEAAVHSSPIDDVHFHEVGGIDAIVDICGACIALDQLGIEAAYCEPLRTGSGVVRSAHGVLPVPAPATSMLLASSRARVAPPLPSEHPPGELLTPTGAAILTTLCAFFQPAYTVTAVGSGFGARQLPWPNLLRATIGETSAQPSAGETDSVLQFETNVDDLSPQHVELLVERLFTAGALDVWTTPIGMKKGRPALLISALAGESNRDAIVETLIVNSTTLGVRISAVERVKATRRFETVLTRWGEVAVKLRGWNGRVIDVAPEYDDCVRLARESGVALRDVWNEAHRVADVYVGRRLAPNGDLIARGRP
jgi:uncharacterized protein (TIGR00299 family) protein